MADAFANYMRDSSARYTKFIESFRLPAYDVEGNILDRRYYVFPRETLQAGLVNNSQPNVINTKVDKNELNPSLTRGVNVYPSDGILFISYNTQPIVDQLTNARKVELEAMHNLNLRLENEIRILQNETNYENRKANNYTIFANEINAKRNELEVAMQDYKIKSERICKRTNVNQYITSDRLKGNENEMNEAVCLSHDLKALTCDNTDNETWSYNFNSQNIVGKDGLCITKGRVNEILHNQTCNNTNINQKWQYREKKFMDAAGNCITPTKYSDVRLGPCTNNNEQQFTFKATKPNDRLPGTIVGVSGIFENNVAEHSSDGLLNCYRKARSKNVKAWAHDPNDPVHMRCKHYSTFKYTVKEDGITSGANQKKDSKTYCVAPTQKVEWSCDTKPRVPNNVVERYINSYPNINNVNDCRQAPITFRTNDVAYKYDNRCETYSHQELMTDRTIKNNIITLNKNKSTTQGAECTYPGDGRNVPETDCFQQATALLFPQPNYVGSPVWYLTVNTAVNIDVSARTSFTMNLQKYGNQVFQSVLIPENFYLQVNFKDDVGAAQELFLIKNTPFIYNKEVTSVSLRQNISNISESLFVDCYEHYHHGGISKRYPMGTYSINPSSDFNGGLSSMRIPQGLYVRLYNKDSVVSPVYTGEVKELGSSGWNDTATRINISNVAPDLCSHKGLVSGFLLRRSVQVPHNISWNISNSPNNSKTIKPPELDRHFATSNTLNVTAVSDFGIENTDFLSYEYTGYLVPTETANYQFGLQSDDASDIALYINNAWKIVASAYGIKPPEGDIQAHYGAENLQASQCYPIRIRFHEHQGGQQLVVSWRQNNGGWNTIPFTAFRLPYTFHQGVDSGGNDIEHRGALNWKDLIARCSQLNNCRGFNTNGWMKHTIGGFSRWSDNPSQGSYIKVNFPNPAEPIAALPPPPPTSATRAAPPPPRPVPFVDCDAAAQRYLNDYGDLRAFFGANDLNGARFHYNSWGRAENRTWRSELCALAPAPQNPANDRSLINYKQNRRKDCSDNDISYHTGINENQCADLCRNNTRCVGFVTGLHLRGKDIGKNDGKCWLKHRMSHFKANDSRSCWTRS